MRGARGVLINITGGPDMTLFEVDEAANRIKEEVDPDANIIVGSTLDESLDGEMRVSVVATGIEARGVTAAAAVTEVPASKPSTLSMPSFRLRAQPAKAASGSGAPAKSAPARGPFADDPFSEARVSGAARERDQVEGQVRAPSESAEAEIANARQSGAAERSFWHPPLPPQERFQEWGKLRAPVRGAERPPSLFERVTASFRNREREGDPEAARGRPEMADPALATAEEDPYDVPAFLRR
jgi:cell division protein FtsZ